jgi:UV DNA damage endonuclease
MTNLGYACINMSMSPVRTTNRTMRKSTLDLKGTAYQSELALQNASDLIYILEWNRQNGIFFFRMSSDMIPWGNTIELTDLPDYKKIAEALRKAGDFAKFHNMRLTMHPGPFTTLSSPSRNVVENGIKDLELHGKVMDLMGLSRTPYNKINIHMGGTHGDKMACLQRFADNFQSLSDSVKSRLTVENDDKESLYTVKDLMYLYENAGIPIVFDFHHWKCQKDPMSEEDALKLAASTWPQGIKPVVHYSESKALHESDNKIKPQAHSDYVNGLPNLYKVEADIMLETKMKEAALLRIREQINMCHYSGLRTVESYELIEILN